MTYEFYTLRESIRHLFLFILLVSVFLGVPVTKARIIIDHSSIAEFDQIPQSFIDEVKRMLLNYPGESHSRALVYGLELLEQQGSKFAVNSTWYGAPELPTNQYLRIFKAHWTGSAWDGSAGEEDTYTNQAAIDKINNHILYCKSTLSNNIDALAFGWCWDMTWHNDVGGGIDPVYNVRWAGSSVGGPNGDLRWGLDDGDTALTGNSVNLQTYLDAFDYYELMNPDTTIIYSTGPVDGGGNVGERGYQRYLKNERIRDWIRNDANRHLFDYADIISYNNEGELSTTEWDGHTFPYIHPDNVGEYDGGQGGCHVSEDACIRLAKAMWVLLAKKAGWGSVPDSYTLNVYTDGNGTVTKSPDKVTYESGEIVTLQANPNTGYEFDNWSGDVNDAVNPINVIMDSNKYVTANFRKVDFEPPSVVSVICYGNSVEILFNEILSRQSAEDLSSYSINNDISIISATLNQDCNRVTLSTSMHSEGVKYTLAVINIEDVTGNPMGQIIIEYDYRDSLVGFWTFYEGFGSTTFDSSDNDNIGVIFGATWIEGRVGKALQFDGIDDYVDCGNEIALNISGESTISTWIKIVVPEYNSDMKIVSTKNKWDATVGWELEYNPSFNRLALSGSGSNLAIAGDVDLDTNWHHIVAVIRGTTATLYCDGVDRTTDPTVGVLVSSSYPLQIGRQSMGGNYFKGLIDEVRIYNRALGEGEILDLFYLVATDLNGDYKVDKFDWAVFANTWSVASDSQNWNYICDLSPCGGDGIVNYKDLAEFCRMWLRVQDIYSYTDIKPVPEPWISMDIGNPSPGSSHYLPEIRTLSVTANGDDIWNQSDNFHYVYQQHSGDCEIIVRLESFPLSVDTLQKAGLMIRDTIDAGSPFVDIVITGGASNYGSFQWRDLFNGNCGKTDAPSNIGGTPKWIRLIRQGNLFSGYWSDDVSTWTQIGITHTTVMTDPVLVGMCVTSHNNDNGTKMATATFGHLGGDFSFHKFIASMPYPFDGATDVPVHTNLTWARGDDAIQDEVYFGTDPCALTLIDVMLVASEEPLVDFTQDLTASRIYYWRIDETDSNAMRHTGGVWRFSTLRGEALPDFPKDGAVISGYKYPQTGKPTHIYTTLDFIMGPSAVTHRGYFSSDYNEVYNRIQDANLGPPPYSEMPFRYYAGLPIVPPATETLIKGETYYWTVDAIDNQGNTFRGDVWDFTIQED